ncbi:MAG: isoprenyl transferase [Bacteroidota bacterium]|nr:isoprenyl transferase [Candidatus Kapabacteria bacterium]MCS7302424.1 isoprenyl transferase [Candidatus Kapabacteria bacterium]MCX7937102.1 isoprenyl transferase [Chlorobiota bacterium]MDW8074595.1 isoprenyl transferase [Bacteroidota bacterium]MDW8270929.1 isoprenyl transferase [Bacteroidota bacterium]
MVGRPQQWLSERTEQDIEQQNALLQLERLPRHVAIIMDGNGRWAVGRKLPRIAGHCEGIESVRDIVKASAELGVEYLTLYAFSTENWRRPQAEVNALMRLLEYYLETELEELDQNNVRLNAIGKIAALPKRVQRILATAIERTRDNTGLVLTLALSYSGRWDLVRAIQLISLDVRRGKLSPEDINENLVSSYLSTHGLPEPDLLIRTSGEQRISNFLLWEIAYTEIYTTETLWPDFRRQEYYTALAEYARRERRFGMTSEQLSWDESGMPSTRSYLSSLFDFLARRRA